MLKLDTSKIKLAAIISICRYVYVEYLHNDVYDLTLGIVNFLFTIIAIKTVDSYGRKPLMIIGALGMAIAMLSLGFVFFSGATGYLALFCMMLYVASFAMSWGPVTWVLLSEIFPTHGALHKPISYSKHGRERAL